MKVNIKKLDSAARIPAYAKSGDAGLDLYAVSITTNLHKITYGTGIAIEIPEGYVGLIFPRSSISKYDLALTNSVGVIDSGYRGEIKFVFNKLDAVDHHEIYKVGDKIGQLVIMPYPQIELNEVDELSISDRGENGFGSTGA